MILARTSSSIVGYGLLKALGEKQIANPIIRQIKLKEEKNYSLASERNLMQAKREYVSLDEEEEEDSVPGRWQDATPSTLPLKLVSTMLFSDPFSSRTVILNLSTNKGFLYSINECDRFQKRYNTNIETVLTPNKWQPDRPCNNIDNIATLRRIEEYRIYIFNNRDRRWEYLSLLGDERRARKPIIFEKPEEGEGIRKIGPNSYEIDQTELDKAFSNVAKLMTDAKAIPKTDANGHIAGFEIVYMKAKSLFEKIGIEKMDLLTRINGYDLSSLEKALELFSKLRYSEKFTIDLKRGGQPVTLDYAVVR